MTTFIALDSRQQRALNMNTRTSFATSTSSSDISLIIIAHNKEGALCTRNSTAQYLIYNWSLPGRPLLPAQFASSLQVLSPLFRAFLVLLARIYSFHNFSMRQQYKTFASPLFLCRLLSTSSIWLADSFTPRKLMETRRFDLPSHPSISYHIPSHSTLSSTSCDHSDSGYTCTDTGQDLAHLASSVLATTQLPSIFGQHISCSTCGWLRTVSISERRRMMSLSHIYPRKIAFFSISSSLIPIDSNYAQTQNSLSYH